ncbi:osmoprotectant transport system substrate-binding protein [Herbaspirillum sp. Sphag1AN]|nr:osmoprotectant transport system substrate-binding protein [Herbaspirillum sp. Sphag1AN]MBB3244118.1 osmoprotectant transport system substrate-binding protein [Herbaspirillum sp. Sphag64]
MKKILSSLLMLCGLTGLSITHAVATPLVIGGKNFTEQLLISTMTAQYLQAQGYEVQLKNGLGSTLMRSALESRQLDIVWEYTGTSLIVYNHVEDKLDAAEAYARVKALDARIGLVWLNESALNNTYAFAMPRKVAKANNVHTLSDLGRLIRQRQAAGPWPGVGVDFEFGSRPDGLLPMQQLYGFKLKRSEIKQMDPGLVYTALRNRQLLAGLTYSSDGRIQGFDLTLLEDDLGYFAPYKATPVVRADVLAQHPQLADQLNALSAVIDTKKMSELNKRVDIDQEPISQVAHDFLQQQGLLSDTTGKPDAPIAPAEPVVPAVPSEAVVPAPVAEPAPAPAPAPKGAPVIGNDSNQANGSTP